MNEETETVSIEIQIPTRIYLCGRRPLLETKEIAREHLQIQAGVLFDFIAYGSALVENRDFDEQQFISLCGVIGKLGSGLTEAMEMVGNDFDGAMKKASLPEVGNENNEMTLPELLSAALKHEDMPEDLKVDLWNFLNDRSEIDADGVGQISLMLGISETPKAESESPERETEDAASLNDAASSEKIYYTQLGERIISIIEDERISETVKNAILAIVESVVFKGFPDETQAEFVRNKFSLAMMNVGGTYRAAVKEILLSVMEACIDDAIYAPIVEKSLGRERHLM